MVAYSTLVKDIESSEDIPDFYPILSLQHKVQAKGRSQERIHATPDEAHGDNLMRTVHSSDLDPFPRDLLLQPSINWRFSALLHHT